MMSFEDLERAGMLLPRQQWGKHQLQSTVNKPWLVIIGIIAVASAAMMYLGDGSLTTWIGVGLFMMALLAFTVLSLRAVEKQRRRSKMKEDQG